MKLALVGSGEYLPSMQDFEKTISRPGRYVQVALAAGKEGQSRLQFWKNMGQDQAARLGMEQDFLSIFDRTAAENFNESLDDAGLIYFSGGNPLYLMQSLENTNLLRAVLKAVESGVALAGCSAGAMMMGAEIVGGKFFFGSKQGLGLVNLKIIPHFDRYGKYFLMGLRDKTNVLGIDEETAIFNIDGQWKVWGRGSVHLNSEQFLHGDVIPIS
jgi:cyanophycinase